MSAESGPGRAFAVDAAGVAVALVGSDARIEHMGFSSAVIAGCDILDDAGLLTESRACLVVAAERAREDPVVFARHLVELCRVASEA